MATVLSICKNNPHTWEQPNIEDKHTVAELDQRYLLTPPEARDAYLVQLVLATREKQPKHSIIIFCKTCRTTELVGLLMTKVGVGSSVLHSMRPQKERSSSLAAFKSGQTKVLVATDVASRGLDIPQVNLVINHSVPRDSVVSVFQHVANLGNDAFMNRYSYKF